MGLLISCPVSESIGSSAGTTRAGEELEDKTTTLKKCPVEKVLVKPKASLSKHPTQLIKHSLIGEDVPEYILLSILETSVLSIITSASQRCLSGKVVLLPLAFIPQHAIGLIYLLESLLRLLFVARIGIRVVFEGKLSKGSLYIFLVGIIRNVQNLVVVFHNIAS